MNIQQKKFLLTIVLSVMVAAFLGNAIAQHYVEANQRRMDERRMDERADKLFESGRIDQFLDVRTNPLNITISRGTTSALQLTFDFKTRYNILELFSKPSQPEVELSNIRVHARVFGSSVAAIPPEEFAKMLREGIPIESEIPVKKYVKLESSSIILHPNSIKTMNMTIEIPHDFPEDMIGESFPIKLTFDVAPSVPVTLHTPMVTVIS